MKFTTGNEYEGFTLVEQNTINEVNGIGRLFIHNGSGAKLYSIENNDDNKVFSISFKTPVNDNMGAAHITEHSVLCGSKKFPIKEPFIELAKGSLNTFLNALTFSDKTMYPVASKNEKDFFNLMDVYLDAVFNPQIYKYKEIFMQEGWHYELDAPENPITYKGVVFNEMKGAFSSPESLLADKVMESLFPDTNYKYDFGGNPDYIPQLSYEKFIDFHKKYYHPSNSYIYLYGNGDINKQLSFINDNYLKFYKKEIINSDISLQKPYGSMLKVESFYPVTENETTQDKTFLTLNYVCGKNTDSECYLALDILEHILLETPASPLKNALSNANIGKDVYGSYDNSIYQPVFNITVKDSNKDKADIFKKVTYDTLNNLVKNGIDKKLIEASINYKEFKLREADYYGYPAGLIYNMKVMDSWLYDGKPEAHLQYEDSLKKIKSALTSDYFEKLIKKYLLDNTHVSNVILLPKKGILEDKEKKTKEKLEKYKKSLGKEELIHIAEETKILKERQSSPDSSEDLKTIPLLSLEDIEKKAYITPTKCIKENNITLLHHDLFTNKIVYMNMYFDISHVSQQNIQYVSLLSSLLGKLATKEHSYIDLSNEININSGGINFTTETFNDNKNIDNYSIRLCMKAKSICEKVPELVKLIIEIINDTIFDDKKRIKELIDERKSRMETFLMDSGHIIAISRLMSHLSNGGYANEEISGLNYYEFLTNIQKNYETMFDEIKNNIERVYESVFSTKNLIISVTCEESTLNNIKDNMNYLKNSIKEKTEADDVRYDKYDFKLKHINEGLIMPSKVQYVAKGYNFRKLGYKYIGSMQVLKTILGYGYLWNKVRVYGGAYGVFAGFQMNGCLYYASYRDPNLKETIDAFDKSSEYIMNFDADKREMTKYIIGTISRLDFPYSASIKGEQSDELFIKNISDKEIQKERDEVLKTEVSDIRKLSELVKDAMKADYLCIVGEGSKIKDNSDMFDTIKDVIH